MANSGTLAIMNVILGVNAKRFHSSIKSVQFKMRKVGRQFKGIGDTISKGLTAPIVGVGVAGVKMSADFGQSMSRINGLVGIAREQTEMWRSDLLKMATEVGKTPRELADGLYFVTSAGLEGTQALDALRASAQASAAGLGEITTVADAVTSAMNAYGGSALSAGDATGILVAAVREGKASADSIAPALGKVVSIASSLDVGFDQVAASIAAMTRVGFSASEASTALRGVLKTLIKPSEETKKALASVGLSAGELRQTIASDGLLSVLDQLKQKFAGNEEGLAKVFSETEAYVGVLNLVGDNAAQVKDIFGELATATKDDLAAAFGPATVEPAFKFNQVVAGISAGLIRLGDIVEPVVLPVIQKLASFADRANIAFANLSPTTQNLIIGIAAVAAAAGPLLIALGAISMTLGTLGGATIAWVAAIAGGAGIVVAGWDAIKVAAVALFDLLKPAFSELGSLFSEIGGMLKEWAVDIWPNLKTVAVAAAVAIGKIWGETGAKILAAVREAWPMVKEGILGTLEVILAQAKAGLQILTGDWDGAWDTMQAALIKATSRIVPIVTIAFLEMKRGVALLAVGIGASVLKILDQLRALGEGFLAMPFISGGAKDTAALALQGINVAMDSIGGGIADATAASKLWKGEADKIKTSLGGANEKLVQMQTGWVTAKLVSGESAAGFQNSWEGGIDVISTKTGELATKLSGGFTRGIKEGIAEIKQDYENVKNEIENGPGLRPPLDRDYMMRQWRSVGYFPDTSGELP
jgi:TP901 family phage tail tape measure protein